MIEIAPVYKVSINPIISFIGVKLHKIGLIDIDNHPNHSKES
tara:strand:+ start:284 stop:409 length:126 start_codon:yes stop_codon:yes gene_type:complete